MVLRIRIWIRKKFLPIRNTSSNKMSKECADIYHFTWPLGLHKGCPTYRRSLQPSKEKIQHFYFPSWIQIQIQPTKITRAVDTDPGFWWPKNWKIQLKIWLSFSFETPIYLSPGSVGDPHPEPDPHPQGQYVFGPSGSGFVSQRYGSKSRSGSGSPYHQAK